MLWGGWSSGVCGGCCCWGGWCGIGVVMIGFVGVFSPAVLLHKCVDSHHIYRVCAITRLVRSHILKGTPIRFQHYHAGYGRDRLTYTRVHGRQSFFGISSSLNFYLSRRLPRNSSAKSWLPFSRLGVVRIQWPELLARWYCFANVGLPAPNSLTISLSWSSHASLCSARALLTTVEPWWVLR